MFYLQDTLDLFVVQVFFRESKDELVKLKLQVGKNQV